MHCPEIISNIIKTSDIVKLHAYHKIALAMAASTPFKFFNCLIVYFFYLLSVKYMPVSY